MREQTPDAFRQNARNVANDVDGVAASQLYVRREAKILANDHAVPDAHRSRKGLVVRVTQSQDELARIAVDVGASDLEAAEVALAETAQSVLFFCDAVASAIQSGKRFFHKEAVTDWCEAVRTIWRADGCELFTGDEVFCNDHILIRFNG